MAQHTRSRAMNCQQFVQYISRSTNDVNRMIQENQSHEVLDNALFRVDSLIVNLNRMEQEIDDETFSSLNDKLKEMVEVIRELHPEEYRDASQQPPVMRTGKAGRPRYDIPEEQLTYLLGLGFSVTKIAELLGIDRSTVYDRLRGLNLSVTASYSDISDEELDDKIREIVQHNRNLGYRYKFVVHGGIDGYSRLVLWLKVATNNKAQTAHNWFEEAVAEYGLPSRVRCDRGVENGRIVEHMVRARGPEHRAAIVGPSVHNQRIERLWVDVFQGSLCVFYDLFRSMESSGALDLTNEVQMFALHYSFRPIIQRSLKRFKAAYNCHPLTSERSQTPQQLFLTGMLEQRNRPTTGVADYWARASQEEVNQLGIDDDGPIPELDRLTSEVRLDDIRCPLPDDVAQQLADTINPLDMCNHDAAIGVYSAVLRFLVNKGYLKKKCTMAYNKLRYETYVFGATSYMYIKGTVSDCTEIRRPLFMFCKGRYTKGHFYFQNFSQVCPSV